MTSGLAKVKQKNYNISFITDGSAPKGPFGSGDRSIANGMKNNNRNGYMRLHFSHKSDSATCTL